MFFESRYQIRIATNRLVSKDNRFTVTDRQELIDGFDQKALEHAVGILIGAGGIGSEVGEGLVRKGIGGLRIYDHDDVELTNLNRQLFYKKDLHKKKGVCLAKNLKAHATCGTALEGYGYSFQDALALGHDMRATFAVVGVDNGETRVEASKLFRTLNMPVIFIAVDLLAEAGYVFVQEPGKACFGCLFPKTMFGSKVPCRTPAAKDILKVTAGIATYAIDTLLMGRKRSWNHREEHLAGFMPSFARIVEKLSDCPLCSTSDS